MTHQKALRRANPPRSVVVSRREKNVGNANVRTGKERSSVIRVAAAGNAPLPLPPPLSNKLGLQLADLPPPRLVFNGNGKSQAGCFKPASVKTEGDLAGNPLPLAIAFALKPPRNLLQYRPDSNRTSRTNHEQPVNETTCCREPAADAPLAIRVLQSLGLPVGGLWSALVPRSPVEFVWAEYDRASSGNEHRTRLCTTAGQFLLAPPLKRFDHSRLGPGRSSSRLACTRKLRGCRSKLQR